MGGAMNLTHDNFSLYGWISPAGDYFPLKGVWEHDEFAKTQFPNIQNPAGHIERMGWLRMSGPSQIMPGFPHLMCRLPLTQKQQDTLFSWCELAGEDYEELRREFGLELQ